jgi:hypothetical protein
MREAIFKKIVVINAKVLREVECLSINCYFIEKVGLPLLLLEVTVSPSSILHIFLISHVSKKNRAKRT